MLRPGHRAAAGPHIPLQSLVADDFPHGDGGGAPTKTRAAFSLPKNATSRVAASRSAPSFTPASLETERERSYSFGSRSRTWKSFRGFAATSFSFPNTDKSESFGETRQLSP